MGLKFQAFFVGVAMIFALSPAAASYDNPIYAFHGADGAYPYSSLIADGSGNLYGTTPSGGGSDGGVVFELKPPSHAGGVWTEQILYKFSVSATRGPFGSLIFDRAGHLFGTTLGGGTNNLGSVFELSPPLRQGGSWIERDIYSFAGGGDGAHPYAAMTIGGAGALFGTTVDGGIVCSRYVLAGCGTVFRLTPPSAKSGAWVETVLHRFNGDDGLAPYAGVTIDRLGNLFGTTIDGGTDSAERFGVHGFPKRPFQPLAIGYDGTAYELSPPSHPGGRWIETILHGFGQQSDGANPYGGLIFDDAGNLYGTTAYGGLASCFFVGATCGTVFELSPSKGGAWTEFVIYLFPPGARQGAAPYAGLTYDNAGNLIGTTQLGGILTNKHTYGTGTVFELTPVHGSWVQSILFEFPDGRDGAAPNAPVIFDASDDLFVTASFGGARDVGGVIELVR